MTRIEHQIVTHVADRLRTGPVARRLSDEWSALAISVAAVAVFAATALDVPAHIDEITITNPTPNRLYVTASTPDNPSTVSVGVISGDRTRTLTDVLDRGPTWVLHLTTRDGHTTEITVDRTDLVAAPGDHVTIPPWVGAELAAAGAVTDAAMGDAVESPTDLGSP